MSITPLWPEFCALCEELDTHLDELSTVLRAPGVPCSDEGVTRLEACGDPGVLNEWLSRVLTASSEVEVFGGRGA